MKKLIESILLMIICLVGFIFFLLSGHFLGFRAFSVMSGSMEPAINTGTMVITKEIMPRELKVGDVITFIKPTKNREFITHRILEISQKSNLFTIKTKGDKNKSGDPWILSGGGVVGKVEYIIPKLGYFVTFCRTKIGIIIFIIVPALAVIYMETTTLLNIVRAYKTKINSAPETVIYIVLLINGIIFFTRFQAADALLSTSVSLSENNFTVYIGALQPDCTQPTDISISGNSARSTNNVAVNENCSYTLIQENHTTIINNINSAVSTQKQ